MEEREAHLFGHEGLGGMGLVVLAQSLWLLALAFLQARRPSLTVQ